WAARRAARRKLRPWPRPRHGEDSRRFEPRPRGARRPIIRRRAGIAHEQFEATKIELAWRLSKASPSGVAFATNPVNGCAHGTERNAGLLARPWSCPETDK